MAEYRLITLWRVAAPLQQAFDAIYDSLRWPEWWPGADSVEQLAAGDCEGIGSIRRYVWKGRLPYRLSFHACATRLEPPWLLEASVSGDLEGIGRWTFSHDGGVTEIRYEWHVRTTRRWMNVLAPLSHKVFANNHHALMSEGADALARLLDARLVECRALPAVEVSRRPQPSNG